MMVREEMWYNRLSSVKPPAGDTLPELGDAVITYLQRFLDGATTSQERDQLTRLCNYWGVSQGWLDQWAKTYKELALKGESDKLLNWLANPAMPKKMVREGDTLTERSSKAS